MRAIAILLRFGAVPLLLLVVLLESDGSSPPDLDRTDATAPGLPLLATAPAGDAVTDSPQPCRGPSRAPGDRSAPPPNETGSPADPDGRAASRPEHRAVSLRVTVRKDGQPCPAVVSIHRFREVDESDASWPWQATVPVPPVFREAACGVDGRAEFSAIPEGYVVIVACSGSDVGWRFSHADAEEVTEVGLDLDRGSRSLRGRVVLGDRPLEGWILPVRDCETPLSNCIPCRTDADGHFEFSGLGEEEVSLVVLGESGLVAVSAPIDPVRTGEVVFDVLADTRAIQGVVVEQPGRLPISGATIRAEHATRFLREFTTTSDARGEFRVPSATPPEELLEQLAVVAPGFVNAFLEWDEMSRRVVVWMQRSGSVAGRILQPGGQPVAGVKVWAAPVVDGDPEWERAKHVVSDAGGRYCLEGLARTDILVVALGNGWATVGVRDLDCDEFTPHMLPLTAAAHAEHDIEVEATGRVVGRVVDADGRPAPGVRVEGDAGADTDDAACPAAVTDREGRFVLEDMPRGEAEVCAWSQRSRASVVVPVNPATATDAELRLERAQPERSVTIRVVDQEGAPIPYAEVAEYPPPWHRADRDGLVRVSTDTRTDLRIYLWADGFVPLDDVPIPDTAVRTTIAMDRGVCLRGIARFADGRPAAGAKIRAVPEDREALPPHAVREWATLAAVDGRFSMQVAGVPLTVSAGLYREQREYFAREDDVDPRSRVELVLRADEESESGVRIRVLGPDGRPVSRGHAYYEGAGREGGVSSDEGEIRGGCLSTYLNRRCDRWVFVVHGAFSHDGRPLGACCGTLFPGQFASPEIRLPPERSITGVICDASGAGIPGCTLEARAAVPGFDLEDDEFLRHGRARTDAAGRFRIGGLGNFTYQLIVRQVPAGTRLPDPLLVRPPAEDVLIRAVHGLECRLTFLDWCGRPVRGVEVSVRDNSEVHPDRGVWAESDAEGVALLRCLSSERRAQLDACAPDRDDLFEVRVENWRPAEQTIRMERAFTVSGQVLDASGTAVEGADVWIKAEKEWRRYHAGPEGRFRIGNLRAGPMRIRASFCHESVRDGADTEQTVAAGASDVSFRLPESRRVSIRISNWPEDVSHAEGRLVWRRSDGTEGSILRSTWDRNQLVFVQIRRDRMYDLWIHAHDAYWYERDRLFTGSDLSIALRTGKTIRGRLVAPAGHQSGPEAKAYCEQGTLRVHGDVDTSGEFEILGLPDGVWTVHGKRNIDGKTYAGTVDAWAGTTCTVTLAPAPD